MAKCDTGYFCRICGTYVEDITESEIYLRFVLREMQLEELYNAPEAHIRCVPELAQYIVDPEFAEAVTVDDPVTDKRQRSPQETAAREQRVTAAWRRLQMLIGSGLDIPEYPLPE